MSRKLQKKVVLALDRLNGRRHTFGLLLTSLIDQLADRIGDFAVLRSQSRSDSVTVKAREIILPRWLESHYLYSALIALFLRYHAVDLVHYPFLYAPYAWWGAGCRRVVTIHGAARAMVPDTLVRRFHPLKLQRYRRAMRAFDAVITVSESSKHDIVRHFLVPPEKVHVIYNGVGRQFRPDQDCNPVLLKYGIPGPYVLSVSTIKPKKNVTATVRAFAELKRQGVPHRLVLVGYTAPGYTEVNQLIRQEGLQETVIQTGFIPADDVPKLYAGADLLIFPSLHEGFGLPVVEAFASGCPVVASSVAALPEVARDAAVYCDPSDVTDISLKMHRVLTDESLRQELIRKGLQRASQFTWERAAESTIDVYRSVMER